MLHVTLFNRLAFFQKTVCERGFAVVDVRHDGKIKPYIEAGHQSLLDEKAKEEVATPVASTTNKLYLFTTSTCPNCKIAKQMLEGQEYTVIDAETNPDLVQKYGIRQAPTLVIDDGVNMKKYVNASNIQKYVDELDD